MDICFDLFGREQDLSVAYSKDMDKFQIELPVLKFHCEWLLRCLHKDS